MLDLIKRADHSVFVRELAVVDWARGRGLASAFLDLADGVAGNRGDPRVTLIVNDQNVAAHRLYVARGFGVTARARSIGHPAFSDESSLLLMEKPVSPVA